jgi:two-component system, OmpR family, alkaline phosphatase synthesis response regulator PhoP
MNKKILLIDDDVDFVEQNRAFLVQKGYSVCCAYNGRDGIEKAVQEKPDLVLLDVMMTEVGEGFEVAREFREREEIQKIPILMLTGVNKEHGFSLQIGPDATWNPVDVFVEKPVERGQLLLKIKELLGDV